MENRIFSDRIASVLLSIGHATAIFSLLGLIHYVVETDVVWKEIYILPVISAVCLTLVTYNYEDILEELQRK